MIAALIGILNNMYLMYTLLMSIYQLASAISKKKLLVQKLVKEYETLERNDQILDNLLENYSNFLSVVGDGIHFIL